MNNVEPRNVHDSSDRSPEALKMENQWIHAAQSGDTRAFGYLVERYQARVLAVVNRIVRDHDLAQDACQQAWIKAWKKLGGFKGESSFYTWIYRVATHSALDSLRRKKRRAEVEFKDEWAGDTVTPAWDATPSERPDKALHNAEIQGAFERALARLSPAHRTVLALREVEGMPYEDIARVMKCRVGTVMSRLYHARQHMRTELEHLR